MAGPMATASVHAGPVGDEVAVLVAAVVGADSRSDRVR